MTVTFSSPVAYAPSHNIVGICFLVNPKSFRPFIIPLTFASPVANAPLHEMFVVCFFDTLSKKSCGFVCEWYVDLLMFFCNCLTHLGTVIWILKIRFIDSIGNSGNSETRNFGIPTEKVAAAPTAATFHRACFLIPPDSPESPKFEKPRTKKT